jgi:hypothetical protein
MFKKIKKGAKVDINKELDALDPNLVERNAIEDKTLAKHRGIMINHELNNQELQS